MATKKSATKKRSTKKSTGHAGSGGKRKWSAKVDTDSTHPPKELFNQSAPTIARELASKKVSPKGPGSGMRMFTFYINRAGKNLPESRLKVLQRAKELLHKRVEETKAEKKPAKKLLRRVQQRNLLEKRERRNLLEDFPLRYSWMIDRAFSALVYVARIPGVLPRANIGRAFGPENHDDPLCAENDL